MGFLFSYFGFSFTWCRAYLMSQLVYPFCWRVCLRCYMSSLRVSASLSMPAPCNSMAVTACFFARWCSDLAWDRGLCVGFLYTACPSEPSSHLVTRMSRKGEAPFFFICIANLMFWWIPFRFLRKSCNLSFLSSHKLNVLSCTWTSELAFWLLFLCVVFCIEACHYWGWGGGGPRTTTFFCS